MKQGHRDAAKQILDMGATKPPGLLHHVARASRDGDMATWLLSIGYCLDEEDKVSPFIYPMEPTNSGYLMPQRCLLLCFCVGRLHAFPLRFGQ